MKNYFRQILTSFTKNHYSEMIRQNFYGWLTDKEHAVEKDKALKEIWTDRKSTRLNSSHIEESRMPSSA